MDRLFVFFDLDGTLVDTEPSAEHALKECFESWKINILPVDTQYIVGRTWDKALDYLAAKYPLPVSREEATKVVLAKYREHLKTDLIFVPGAAKAVADLANRYPLALVSGSFRAEILWILDRLGVRQYFQVILGAEDYVNSKPAPDGYLKAIRALYARPSECLVFEDSEAGIASALAAGMQVVAVEKTNHFGQDQSKAHHKVHDLSEVNVEWVRKHFGHIRGLD